MILFLHHFLKIYYFFFMYLKGTVTEGQRKVRDPYLLVHSPNDHNIWAYAKLEAESLDSLQISHVDARTQAPESLCSRPSQAH